MGGEGDKALRASVLGKHRRSSSSGGPPGPLLEDFECVVCCDLLLDPVVGPCGHDMCSHCYQRWLQTVGSNPFCPLCRCALPGNLAVCLRLKKTLELLHPEAVDRRRREVQQAAADSKTSNASEATLLTLQQQQQPPDLPTYPQGPYPLDLATQWAAATAAGPHPAMAAMMVYLSGAVAGAAMSGSSSSAQQQQQQQLASAATAAQGMPAIMQVCGVHMGAAGETSCWSLARPGCSTAASATSRVAAAAALEGELAGAEATADGESERHGWQAASDGPDRLQLARAIIHTLQVQGLHLRLGPKLPDAVRLLELILYRTAASKSAYLDPLSLDGRIAAAVRQRLGVAAARSRGGAGADVESALPSDL